MKYGISVKLISDFMEPYDHWFDRGGHQYYRMSTHLPRREAHDRLEGMHLNVPYNGTVESMWTLGYASLHTPIVVYLDEYAHSCNGIERMLVKDAMVKGYGGYHASVCIPPSEWHAQKRCRPLGDRSTSLRYLRIGSETWWLEYWSKDEWRSNYGDVDISLASSYMNVPRGFLDEEPYPMLAADFVKSRYGAWYAVDYNTSPGLRGTPVLEPAEGGCTHEGIVELIKEWFAADEGINIGRYARELKEWGRQT